ncbi:MAG: type II toxin-antitoxin system Phd/YefM family antitoxin [Bradymonadia bacterium]
MSRIPAIIPVTDLRQDSAAVLEKLKHSDEPVVITQRGRAAAVLLDVDAYERLANERDLLLALAEGERAIRRGEVSTAKEVFDDLDTLFDEDAPE